jgi:hypothetical protein
MLLCRRGRRVACHGHNYLFEFVFEKSKVNNDGRWLTFFFYLLLGNHELIYVYFN